MCGIFGYLGNIDKMLAQDCLDKLIHRGPDASGLWHQKNITLGHRRLSILDLSELGTQPMSYMDGRYWITFNGEIYNFIEIRNRLKGKGYIFKSDSDTEVILAAYCEWGEKCLDLFNGMWAFAIWDNKEQKLFISRDRFGKKPLFYIKSKNGIAFASEMKALLPLMDCVEPNTDLINNKRKMFLYESTDECLIKSIKRFPAGSYAVVDSYNFEIKRWWCTLDNLIDVPKKYSGQVEAFRELFFDACRIRMRSDVPLGTALSGGLDSSSIISAMAHIKSDSKESRINNDWQHAFVASFPDTPLDETHFANEVTNHLGIKSKIINVDPLSFINNMDRFLYLFEDIYITSPIPFMMVYNNIKSSGISVSIDGHGADELFGGYTFDFIYALNDAGINLPKANMILSAFNNSFPKQSSQFSKLEPKLKLWLKWHVKNVLGRNNRYSDLYHEDFNHENWRKLDSLNKQLYISTHMGILPTLLRNYDRYSMANSVEIRMPFMDHRIVSFAFSLPWSSKIRNGFSKSIVRDAMAPILPPSIAYRKSKIGFNSPFVDWIKGPLKEYFIDIINSNSFKTSNIINSIVVADLINKVISDENATFSMGENAWASIMPYLWEQAFIKPAL
ncbi:MAG: asparagine synthase (glutamine-hydrolyzing) [Clostridia bacterium]|nr:asparagine synthase (glutamine-hydrolyzing) [Clostridia bacterium]